MFRRRTSYDFTTERALTGPFARAVTVRDFGHPSLPKLVLRE
jgi:hypothetical protein